MIYDPSVEEHNIEKEAVYSGRGSSNEHQIRQLGDKM